MPRLIIRMIVIVGLAMGCAIAGAGVEMRGPDLNADLAHLCYSGSADAIAAALRDGRLTVNARDERGHSPLHLAVTANHDLEAVREWQTEVVFLHGARYYAWSACVRKPGFETREVPVPEAGGLASVRLEPGDALDCPGVGRDFMIPPKAARTPAP